MKRAKHNLSHYKLFTGDMGHLIPISWYEGLPGDTIQQRTSALIRVSPLVAPVMHPTTVRLHTFFVPYRILWEGWEDFITGVDETSPPFTTGYTVSAGLLDDYLGVPPGTNRTFSLLPRRAYNKIYNEFYRDQDLVQEVGEDTVQLRRVAWEKDYFTSARPWAQKGGDVTIPLGDKAPIIGLGVEGSSYPVSNANVNEAGGAAVYATATELDTPAPNRALIEQDPNNPGFPNLYADLSSATPVDVREFRLAFALQRYQEARARYGSRYTEYLAYLGVKSADQRLQRPEYLGGGKTTLTFSEVLQTWDDSGGRSLGSMGGHGIAAVQSKRFRKFLPEHGIVMTLMSVRPKTVYMQAQHRSFNKNLKEDYFQRELQHIGAQSVAERELYADSAEPDKAFGYQDRYREYRELPSTVAGEFRSTLNYWHMGRTFESDPALNDTFVRCEPSKRIHAEQTNHQLWVMGYQSIQARRLVAKNASIGRIV